jgi:hypothetical protein
MKKTIIAIVKWTFIGTFVLGIFSALILNVDTTQVEEPKKQMTKEEELKLAKEQAMTLVEYNKKFEVRNAIKSTLNDEESFEVENENIYFLNDTTIVYDLEYSAKNAFGGRIKKQYSQKFFL